MELYEGVINQFLTTLNKESIKQLKIPEDDWEDLGNQNMILRSEMAYELGGGNLPAISSLCITTKDSDVKEDEVDLVGEDLPQLTSDSPYARLTILKVKEEGLGQADSLYQAIQKLEFVRYHIHPKGYMMRISSTKREPVRIGQQALNEGLDFAKVGKRFIKEYHQNQNVLAVKCIFITKPDFPYDKWKAIADINETILTGIDHISKDFKMDCSVCQLKSVCDEVEGMKEYHFAQQNQLSSKGR